MRLTTEGLRVRPLTPANYLCMGVNVICQVLWVGTVVQDHLQPCRRAALQRLKETTKKAKIKVASRKQWVAKHFWLILIFLGASRTVNIHYRLLLSFYVRWRRGHILAERQIGVNLAIATVDSFHAKWLQSNNKWLSAYVLKRGSINKGKVWKREACLKCLKMQYCYYNY